MIIVLILIGFYDNKKCKLVSHKDQRMQSKSDLSKLSLWRHLFWGLTTGVFQGSSRVPNGLYRKLLGLCNTVYLGFPFFKSTELSNSSIPETRSPEPQSRNPQAEPRNRNA